MRNCIYARVAFIRRQVNLDCQNIEQRAIFRAFIYFAIYRAGITPVIQHTAEGNNPKSNYLLLQAYVREPTRRKQ